MRPIERAEDALRFTLKVGPPDVFGVQDGEGRSTVVKQGEPGALLDAVRHILGYVEGDGDRPQGAGFEAHGFENAVVVVSVQESTQRRETAVQEQFEIAQLARVQGEAGQIGGLALQSRSFLPGDEEMGMRLGVVLRGQTGCSLQDAQAGWLKTPSSGGQGRGLLHRSGTQGSCVGVA